MKVKGSFNKLKILSIMYQHTVEKDSYYKNKKQKSNVASCTPLDNTLLRLCFLPLQDDDDTSKDMSSNNAAASSIFGVSMDDGASSMSSVSYNTYICIHCFCLTFVLYSHNMSTRLPLTPLPCIQNINHRYL